MNAATHMGEAAPKAKRHTPRPLKSFLQSGPFRAALYAILAGYMRLLRSTTRWTIVREDIPKSFWDQNEPFILAFWHGRNLVSHVCWRTDKQINMLASQHRDGDITENVLKKLGLKTLRGSSGNPAKGKMAKGGATALRNMARLLQAKESIGITPDGPRGPRMRAGEGVVAIARLSGAPVITAAVAVQRARVLATWDRLMVPLPWSRGAIVWGEPVYVSRDGGQAEIDRARLAIETTMNRALEAADALVGHPAVEPAPLDSSTGPLAAASRKIPA